MYILCSDRPSKTYEDYENSGKFTEDQLSQIYSGFEYNIPARGIDLYADPEFNPNQMYEIWDGFNHLLEFRDVLLYADPKFNWKQMYEIKQGLIWGLDHDTIRKYADPIYDDTQMEVLRHALCDVNEGFEDELDELIFNPEYSSVLMSKIYRLWAIETPSDQIDLFIELAKPLNDEQVEAVSRGFEDHLTEAQIKSYARPDISADAMLKLERQFEYENYLNKMGMEH